MCPNCSSCNEAVTLGCKINKVMECVGTGLGAYRFFDFSFDFFSPLPLYQFLIQNLKAIYYHDILQVEASFNR